MFYGTGPGNRGSVVVQSSISILILINVIAVLFKSYASVRNSFFGQHLMALEYFSVVVFTIEYFMRVWSCTSDPAFARPVAGRLKFMMRPLAILDLIAIAPFYMPGINVNLLLLRVFRLFRLVKLDRLWKYAKSIELLGRIFRERKEEMLIAFSILLSLTFVSSTLLYYAENAAQPEKFSSIPAAMWCSIITLTSVGYGDIYPITVLGKIIAAATAILGGMMFAVPTGILAAGFIGHFRQMNMHGKCPTCGRQADENDGG
ncbi:MAG: ion transporter [Myxococcota bacterium]|jgi:voltage-gated potassium channel